MRKSLIPLLFLSACASAPPPVVATAPQPIVDPTSLAVRGVPGYGPYRVLVLAGEGVDDLELYTVLYGLTAQGWRATVAAPTTEPVRASSGRPVPVDVALAEAEPERFDVLFVPGGAPSTGAAADLARRFAAERHLATTAAGAKVLAAAGVSVDGRVASDAEMVKIDGNLLSAARPGDLANLLHALEAYAHDKFR